MRWSTPALWTVLFGVAATIASAWLCALVSPLSDAEFLISSSNTGLSAPRPARWRVGVPEDWTIRTWLARSGVGTRHDTVSECIWMGSTLGSSEATNPNRTKVMLTTGWPLPAMQATAWDVTAPTASRSTYFRTSWENGLQLRPG